MHFLKLFFILKSIEVDANSITIATQIQGDVDTVQFVSF